MSAATSPGTGLAYGLTAGLRRLGHGPLLVLRHDLRPARRAAAGKASGTEARDLGPGAAGGDRSRPGGIALGGRGLPQGLGSASGLSRHPGCPQAGAPPDAENNLLSPHRCRRRGGNPHDGEIITHAPNLLWGTAWRSGVPVTTAGAGSSRRRALERHVSAGMSASAATASPPWPISMGLARAVWLDRGRRGSGAWPCGWITAPSICRPLHQPDQVLGHPAVLRLRRRAPDQRRRRAVQSHAEGTDHPWSHHRNIAELRDAVRDFVELYNAQWIVEKNGYLSPVKLVRRGTPRSRIRPAA